MNYCSIEDAWGKSNYASNQFKEYMTNTNSNLELDEDNINHNVEQFTETKNKQNNGKKNKNKKEKIHNHLDELNECELFMIHVKNCRKCYNKIKNQFKPKLIENFQTIINDNKDTIVLILIGISILLFFNLINNITK
jgi:hypothetical protein